MSTEVGVSLKLIEKNPLDAKNVVATLAEANSLAYEGYNPYIKELGGFYTYINENAVLVPKAGVTFETVQTLIANIVDSSPATLDTLKELALAVNNDPNFGAGMISNIGTINTQIAKILSVIAIAPTYTAPVANINGNGGSTTTVERGTSMNGFALNIGFVKNDGGLATSFKLLRNGAVISNTQNNTQTEANITAQINFQAQVSYAEGGLKNNNLGIIDGANHILAGTVSSGIYAIAPRLYYFWGSALAVPTNSAEGRLLPLKVNDGVTSIDLPTGTINKKFCVLLPSNRHITSVTDITNSGASLTSNYVLVNNVFVLNDAGGNPQTYNLYVCSNAVPYSTSATHRIIIA